MTKWFKPLGQGEGFLLRVTSSYALLKNELIPIPGGYHYIQLILCFAPLTLVVTGFYWKLVRIAKKDYFTVQETVLPLQQHPWRLFSRWLMVIFVLSRGAFLKKSSQPSKNLVMVNVISKVLQHGGTQPLK